MSLKADGIGPLNGAQRGSNQPRQQGDVSEQKKPGFHDYPPYGGGVKGWILFLTTPIRWPAKLLVHGLAGRDLSKVQLK